MLSGTKGRGKAFIGGVARSAKVLSYLALEFRISEVTLHAWNRRRLIGRGMHAISLSLILSVRGYDCLSYLFG